MNSKILEENKQSAGTKTSKKIKKGDNNARKGKIKPNIANKWRKLRKLPKGRGIIYIGRIPHGFYEDEMSSYFNQFGTVTATAVARSKKTGRSKGYGFVEFLDKEVAKIAAETMNNYLMFNRIIKCKYIPPEERSVKVCSGKISTTDYPRKRCRTITMRNNKKAISNLNQETYVKKVQRKVEEFKKFFEENGIDFTMNIGNEKTDVKSKSEEASSTSAHPELQSDTENQFGVLEIDESDDEISFKTPPKVKKVIKKSLDSPLTSSTKLAISKKSQKKKEIKLKQMKDKKSSKIQGKEKTKLKSDVDLKSIRQKLDRKVKRVKLEQPVIAKTKISPKKDINAMIKQKNLKVKKSSGSKESKKEKVVKMGPKFSSSNVKKASKKIKANP